MLADALGRATGRQFARAPGADVHGGSIHRCVRWETNAGPVFVKLASAAEADLFEAEAAGLRALAEAHVVRVPDVIATVTTPSDAALVLEWLDFGGTDSRAEARLGQQLAALHRVEGPAYGWHRDNTIGRTPQVNTPGDDWPRFYAEQRLGFQLRLAERNGLSARIVSRGRALADRCAEYFTDYRPAPSLLHGDLWGGNWAVERSSGAPVLFDPAVYFGDREADLAMTRLFGGFGPAFYEAYEQAWPLDAGARTRRPLYDLYHVLNHYNLFGGGYGTRAAGLIERLLDGR